MCHSNPFSACAFVAGMFSMSAGSTSPWKIILKRLLICPFLSTKRLDFLGLNFMRAYVTVSSGEKMTHLACTCTGVVVVTVRSSMKPLIGGTFYTLSLAFLFLFLLLSSSSSSRSQIILVKLCSLSQSPFPVAAMMS